MTVLKTPRLTLAPPFIHEGMDVSHYLKWLNNDAVMQFSEQRHITHTTGSQYEYLTSFTKTSNLFWEIQKDQTPIGSITAYRNTANHTANIGIMIGETRYWNRGFASEAWDAVCQYLFEQNTRKIEAGCMASNHAMRSLLDKMEFTHEATIPGHFLRMGKPEDLYCYGKTRQAKVVQLKKDNGAKTSTVG